MLVHEANQPLYTQQRFSKQRTGLGRRSRRVGNLKEEKKEEEKKEAEEERRRESNVDFEKKLTCSNDSDKIKAIR